MKPIALTGLLVTVLALAVPHAAGQTQEYTTYLDAGSPHIGVAADAAGHAYVCGGDFAAKLTPAGNGVVWRIARRSPPTSPYRTPAQRDPACGMFA